MRPLWLPPLKFSLRATIDHHGPSIHSGHNTASINCCKNHSIATITQLRSLKLLIAKTPLLHMLYHMNWLTYEFWTRTGGWEFDCSNGAGTSSPSHRQQVEEQAPKPVDWIMCFLMTFIPVQKLWVYIYICIYIYIYIYVCILYMISVIGCIYTYIQQESRSVLVKLHPITFYRTVFLGSARLSLFVFFSLPILSCSMINSLILGCLLVTFGICFKQHFDTRYVAFCNLSSPGCFCPWTFFRNIGFNMVPSDPFMSHLATQLGYSAGEFQALQLIVLASYGVVD